MPRDSLSDERREALAAQALRAQFAGLEAEERGHRNLEKFRPTDECRKLLTLSREFLDGVL